MSQNKDQECLCCGDDSESCSCSDCDCLEDSISYEPKSSCDCCGDDKDSCKCSDCDCHEDSISQIETDDEHECCCGDSCKCSDCNCHEVRSNSFSETDDELSSEDSDDYENDDKSSVLRGKWLYDGSNNIDEMIEALQREITLLEDLKKDGWTLQEKVMNDHAYLVKVDE